MWARVTLAILTAAFCTLVSKADIITHFGDNVGDPGVPPSLDAVGIGHDNVASENTVTTFTVPGAPGQNVNATFTFLWDTGGFQFSFGFTDTSNIPFDPISQRQQWAAEALSPARATLVFDDRLVDPVVTSSPFLLAQGNQLVFFVIPDNTLDSFRNNPAAFYQDSTGHGNGNDTFRSPLFSETSANPGEFDQMLSFAVGPNQVPPNGTAMFAFEDLTRTAGSDNSFSDLIFSVNVGVPEPASAPLLIILAMFSIATRGLR